MATPTADPRPSSGPATRPARRDVLRGTLAAAGGMALGTGVLAPRGASAAGVRRVAYYGWKRTGLSVGILQGVTQQPTEVAMTSAAFQRSYADPGGATRLYDVAVWTSPVVTTPFLFTQAVASWNVWTPPGTWVEARVQVWNAGGGSGWMVLGRWGRDDPAGGGAIHRRSLPGQSTGPARVATDTVVANTGGLTKVAVQVLLHRPRGSSGPGPTLALASVVVSNVPGVGAVTTSAPGPARGRVLAVPSLSQEVHRGHYPQWDGGGEAWCSPTATAMVVQYWGKGPTASDIAWVQPSYDGHVDVAARGVYDYAYEGCGNWSFNVAYAACFGLETFVTRLRSLAEAELFVAAGIPLVVSLSFSRAQLPSAGYASAGHLMVVCGFTSGGDVVVNDPASHLVPDDARVRTVYPRGQFESAWLNGSGGTAYVIRPVGYRLPIPPAEANWPSA